MTNYTNSLVIFNCRWIKLICSTIWLCALAMPSYAVERDMGASVTFTSALSITKEDIAFGQIQYTLGAGANTLSLSAATSALTCSNTTEYTCPPNGTRGELNIAGSNGQSVNISCRDDAALSNGTTTITMDSVRFAKEGETYGCQGLEQPSLAYTLGGGADQFYLGGNVRISVSGVGEGGGFSTSAVNGRAVSVRVVYL